LACFGACPARLGYRRLDFYNWDARMKAYCGFHELKAYDLSGALFGENYAKGFQQDGEVKHQRMTA